MRNSGNRDVIIFEFIFRLETGWSTFAENVYRRQHGTSISDEEQDKILTILQQAQEIEEKEQERIGYLLKL